MSSHESNGGAGLQRAGPPMFMSAAEDMPSMQIVSDPNDDNDEDANDDN